MRLELRLWPRVAVPRWLGLRFDTDVVCHLDRPTPEVVHRSWVRWLGLPLYHSVETMFLDPDGRSFAVRGVLKWPTFWSPEALTGTGTIHEGEPHAASYAFQFRMLGATVDLAQDTRWEGDHLAVSQRNRWVQGVQRIARR